MLQLLSLENLRDANQVHDVYVAKCKDAGRSVDLPLFNFTRFLLLTLEVRAWLNRWMQVMYSLVICHSGMRFHCSRCCRTDMPVRYRGTQRSRAYVLTAASFSCD